MATGNVTIVLRGQSIAPIDMDTLRSQLQSFLQTTLAAALTAANPTTTASVTFDKGASQYVQTG